MKTADVAASPSMMQAAAQATQSVSKPPPSHEQIAARAFEYYLARGGEAGNELSDWLRAEGELRAS